MRFFGLNLLAPLDNIYIFIHQITVATKKIKKRKENLTKLNYNECHFRLGNRSPSASLLLLI